ncbi:filamentous hemagglutinin family protein [Variovorax sp. LT2P21]|uniref:filamentous haemagglutinin family protein n=1 Tax=Variovorax sp. LT2P21 TaxID=3443731 RepID=UPI003F44CDD7
MSQALALIVATGGFVGPAYAQRAFSPQWFDAKSAAQSTATATGRLPNGMSAASLNAPAQLRNSEQAQRSMENLSLAARGIAAQQAAQAAAREAALAAGSDIPDGLADGGLKVDTNSLTAGWLNAKAPVQTAAGGRTVVGIEQTDEKAILNWESFNVGKNTTVKFDQSKGRNEKDGTNNWIALNRINDPSGRPSQIAGQIQADGSVYLINRNGIIFNGSSQVNTRSLVASSLRLTDQQFNLGINNAQVMESQSAQYPIPQFGEFTAQKPWVYSPDGGYVAGNGVVPDRLGLVDRFDPGLPPGAVTVAAGAQLDVSSGGKLMLFAPKVSNAGRLFAPDGQVILAAGENVYLKNPSAQDPNPVRGLDVAASAVPGWALNSSFLNGALGLSPIVYQYGIGVRDVVVPEMAARAKAVGYEVVNSGTVQADRGNITLQAQDVRQNGVLLSTTALNNRNGSIQLRAWGLATRQYGSDIDQFYNWSAGTLTLGSGSVTQIMPDATDTSEIEASALGTRYQPGWIGMYGKLIDIQSKAGVLAPAGNINIETAANPLFRGQPQSLGDGSRIYLDSDAFLSVAGLQDMLVPMSRNFVEAELRINELRDSPLMLNSWLRGKKVIVDRREHGVFADGPMAGVQWVLGPDGKTYLPGEWVGTPLADVAGWIGVGKTDLRELSADAGSIMLRAGGSVITRTGSMLDISGGSVRYSDGMNTATKLAGVDGGIYTMNKAMPDIEYAGLAGQFTQTHARWGVSTTWRSALIGGDFKEAGYTEGRKAGAVQIFAGDAMVLEGDMWGGVITGERQQNKPVGNTGGKLILGGGTVPDKPWSPGNIIVSHDPQRLSDAFNAGTALGADFYVPLDPANPRSKKLTLLSDDMLSSSGMGAVTFFISKGDVEVATGAHVEFSPGTSLLITGGENSTGAIRINGTIRSAGGSISLDSLYGQLEFGAQAGLDVSGQWINAWRDGRSSGPWAIDGGAITLNARKIMADDNAVFDVSGGGRVDLGKKGLPSLRVGDAGSISLTGVTPDMGLASLNLRAYAAGSAGSLFLETPSSVQVGGARNDPSVVVLPANLFGDRGFGKVSVAVRTDGSIEVPDGVTVGQQAVGIDLNSFAYRDVATGTRLADVAPIAVLTLQERLQRDPGGLTLGTEAGAIRVGTGASIVTDTGGTLKLAAGGAGALTVLGRLEAPAGRIDLSGKTVGLASGAQLLARGVPAIYLDKTGHVQGAVLSGGVVDIVGADVQLAAGSLIDVSGASGEIEQAQAGGAFRQVSYKKRGLASDGGTVNIRGEGLVVATLVGQAGGAGAQGGSLSIQHVPAGPGANLADELLKSFCQIDASFCTPESVIGVDFALLLGYNPGDKPPMVITQAIFDHLGSASRNSLVVSTVASAGAGQGGPGIDYAALGLSEVVVNLFRDELYIDLRALTPSSSLLVARPESFSRGGFANLALASRGGSIELGDVQLSANRSITVDGTLRHAVGESGQASLAAAYIGLKQTSSRIAPAAVANRTGSLTLSADVIDVVGGVNGLESTFGPASIRSFASTALNAPELRFSANNAAVNPTMPADAATAALDVDGALTITAGQVYPSTAVNAKILSSESITVGRSGDSSVVPLSAGGTLRLEAPVIEQNGVLRAPFGQIELVAGDRLSLGADSITSVSGAGLLLPYGTLLNNENWKDPANAGDGASASSGTLTSPPEKRITMKSPNVDLAKGAVIDITGGGDLYAWEFVPGPGGSNDLLARPGMFAVMPGQQASAPVTGVDAGQRVWLAGGPGLAAGWYTLLPARYALLPGAFAVQSTGNAWEGPVALGFAMRDGSLIMQGTNGNSYGGSQDAQASAWRVMPGATVRKYTEYNEAFANDFFSSEAFKLTQYRLTGQDIVTPRLARDGGAVVFEATTRLTLDGTLLSQADKGGRGGLVDIAGKKIAIVGAGQDAASLQAGGYLVIDATSLSNFGAGSLLVGGTRKGDLLGTELDVTATDIVVRNGAGSELSGPEIILAASEQVAVDAGSIVSARGTGASSSGNLLMKPQQAAVYDTKGTPETTDDVLVTPAKDWGALIRVANGEAIKVVRQNVDTTQGGLVTIGAGAVLNGGEALLIDATRTTELASSARISGVDLSVSAGRIGFGGGSGMVLDSAALAQLADSRRLTLRSYSSFDFHQSVDLGAAGLASLTLDGAAITGHGGDIVIKGDEITLQNSGANLAATGNGNGNFTLDAATLVLGAGQKNFAGFDSISLGGRDQIVGAGKGGIDTGAIALNLNTALLTGRGGAAQSIVTAGQLYVTAAPGGSPAQQDLQDSLGARLSLSGASIVFGSRAVALGGSIDMTATAGGLTLADGAQIDVGGFAKQFFDVAGYADAGSIKLSAVGGDVRLHGGSQLNLAAHKSGGSAGALNVAAAAGGTVVLEGTINAQAGTGGKAGAFSLDIAELTDFAGLSQHLNAAGFNRSRQFRIRQGDITLDGTTTVEDFGLTADQGRITIAGTVDARAAYGGAIRITGGNGVTMNSGAQLLAGATGELGSGRVTLEAAGGELDLQGGTIDVAGNEGGKVRLRAQQNAAHTDLNASAVNVSIAGARSAVIEGVATYNASTVDSVKAAAIADANQFSAAAPAVAARLGTSLAVMPGIAIESAGDLTMNSDWNLRSDFAGAREGTLTLRAGGNLIVNGHLSDGFDNADRTGKLQEGASWNLRLVAGADLDSANTLAVKPLAAQTAGSGNITIGTADTDPDAAIDNGAGKLIRTGTGDLEVRAGRDLLLAHKESVIYTAGRKDMTTWSDFTTANAAAIYGIEGGNLDLAAQGSIEAQPAGQRFVEWLNRQGNLNTQGYFGEYESQTLGTRPDGSYGYLLMPPEQSSWWINYGAFKQGVGALGGGNVTVNAGGDLGNLVVVLPTTMRMRGGRSSAELMAMETRNGGTMTIEAGGTLRGGQYYVARGAGDIKAGETAAGNTVSVIWNEGAPDSRVYTFPVAPVLALGDATLNVRTAGDLRVQTVVDPLLVRYGNDGSGTDPLPRREYGAYMSGYTDRTALKLVSTGGNITFVNQADFIFHDLSLSFGSPGHDLIGQGGNRFPARLAALAMNGSLEIQGPVSVMPGATNDVQLIAQGDIRFATQNREALNALNLQGDMEAQVIMPYATPAMMPSAFKPRGMGFSWMARLLANPITPYGTDPTMLAFGNPDVLPLASDFEPSRIYAGHGSILGLDLTANEQTWVRAGTDIRGLRVNARNVRASDVTLLEAGNDFLAMANVRAATLNTPEDTGSMAIQGPGTLVLSAGRDVYADNLKIQTLGNQQYDLNNRPMAGTQIKGLPSQGASITVMAGMNQAAAYDAFASAYLDPAKVAAMPGYLKTVGADGSVLPSYLADLVESRPGGQQKTVRRGLVSYMVDMTGETLAPLDAWTRFQVLPALAQQQFIRQVYLLELREAGRDQNEPGIGGLPRNGGYNRGYAAIATLFPGDGWKGDVAANKLMLRTMAGGDINVLTPGGGLQVAALGATVPDGYGLVTLASGHINVFANDDVTVNRSRILSFVPEATQQGSDQIIWSTVGDIDAGRGSKTVRVPSAPEVITDLDGVTVIREKSDMSGSGIGTVGDGDVDLVAPLGTVNAGDAGLRVAGNLNIAALQVLNADNIQVKGEIKGLPVIAAVNIGALTNASAAASQATAAAQEVIQRERATARQSLPSVFTVRVLGFGSEPVPSSDRPNEPRTPAPVGARYDAGSAFQLLGQGALAPDQRARLTEVEQSRLMR